MENSTQAENNLDISGVITVPGSVDEEKFTDEFLQWLESKGYSFGGGIGIHDENDLPR